MFEVSEETKEQAITAILATLTRHGIHDVKHDVASEAFDVAVEIVKRQFGL